LGRRPEVGVRHPGARQQQAVRQPVEIGQAVVFLASDASSFAAGAELIIGAGPELRASSGAAAQRRDARRAETKAYRLGRALGRA
jgi:hypothetical protein